MDFCLQVIADMREFSSELPSAVYGSGVDVLPVTLEVGDYVLAPGVCIERKSLQDLVQSLQSGRVFKQAEQVLLQEILLFAHVEN